MEENPLGQMHYMVQCAKQRAALMALVACILEADDEKSIKEAKNMCVDVFARMIDRGHMAGDSIDITIAEKAKAYCEVEAAVDSVNEFLNQSKN